VFNNWYAEHRGDEQEVLASVCRRKVISMEVRIVMQKPTHAWFYMNWISVQNMLQITSMGQRLPFKLDWMLRKTKRDARFETRHFVFSTVHVSADGHKAAIVTGSCCYSELQY
jgi:hypothetical protein